MKIEDDELFRLFEDVKEVAGNDYATLDRLSYVQGWAANNRNTGRVVIGENLISRAPDRDTLIAVLAHELGHMEGRPHPSFVMDEMRADNNAARYLDRLGIPRCAIKRAFDVTSKDNDFDNLLWLPRRINQERLCRGLPPSNTMRTLDARP
jgi:hypothetical protein